MGGENMKIGGRLKTRRTARKLSLEQLAGMSGVSKAMLSQIEQNKVNPTLVVILKIVDALQITLEDLVGTPQRNNILRVIPAADKHYTYRADEQTTLRTLSPISLEKSIEFYRILLETGGELISEAHFPGTEEFLYLARGKLQVTSGAQTAIINKDDSVHYRADVTHVLKNIGKGTLEAYLVVWYKNE
ncbi:MAG: helix-turn-helix transcriptional regulator [Sedimentisphaerales bacterium]|nr:helix-turn-helix transcriptional regulator [Sedimentisphaerales bacterium]